MTNEDPWATDGEATGGPEEGKEADAVLRGLSWAMVHDVAAAPLRTQPTIMRMASALVREPAMTSTPQALAKRLKVTEVAVMEAASRMPTLFALQAGGHRIRLKAEGEDPAVESPRQRAEREKGERASERARHDEQVRAARDDEDTPFNRLRADLEACGLSRVEARGFAGQLSKTYPIDMARSAAQVTASSAAQDPKGYVMAILKSSVGQAASSRICRRVPAFAKPSGVRETLFVGWSADRTEPRQMLYRLPSGRIKRCDPGPDNLPPSHEEDPGCQVMQ